MRDRLPRISVKTDQPPDQFLDSLALAARQTGEYLVEFGAEDGTPTLTVKPLKLLPHRELEGRLVHIPGDDARIQIGLHAVRWNPEPPTYETYVSAAREMLQPLLHRYNLVNRSNRKLQIASKSASQPHLPPMARELFDSFTIDARKSGLREADWRRFYRFIRHASAHNLRLGRDDIHWLLVDGGFSIEHAAEIADVYEHGRGLLRERGDAGIVAGE